MSDTKKKGSIVNMTWQHDGQLKIVVRNTGELIFNPGRASLLNRKAAECFGWANKFANKMSVGAGENGKTDPAEKLKLAVALRDHFESGTDEWDMPRGPVQKGPDAGLVIQAMIELGKATDPEHAERRIAGIVAAGKAADRDGAIKALWDAKDITLQVADIRARRRVESLSATADDLLNGVD